MELECAFNLFMYPSVHQSMGGYACGLFQPQFIYKVGFCL